MSGAEPGAAPFAEDAYGVAKRFVFCAERIAAARPALVLDIGCGTGERLTRPLAERFPAVRFVGIDNDVPSIAYARSRPALPNLSFGDEVELARVAAADLIIASEVLEHVESPEFFLRSLGARLAPQGLLIVTTPNGAGPCEIASLVEVLLRLSGGFDLLRRLRRALRGGTAAAGGTPETLAASPHINFFSKRALEALFAAAGFDLLGYRPRTFLCGFGLDYLMRGAARTAWNARIADRLPAAWASDWMFVLRRGSPRPAPEYRRGPLARWRRSLNERWQARAGAKAGAT